MVLIYLAETVIKNAIWVGYTAVWSALGWIYPSKEKRKQEELINDIKILRNENTEMNNNIKNIKFMLNHELNILDVINMCDYVEIIDKPDEITASKTVHNSIVLDKN